VATRTLHLERGRLTSYSGNYSFFDRAWQQRRQRELAEYQRQQDHIRQTEAFIRKNIAGQKTKQAQSRRKQLAREERLERPESARPLFRLDLKAARRSGDMVFQAEGLEKRYDGEALVSGLDLVVSRRDRLGVIGPNGCGKSTLLKLLAGLTTPDGGWVKPGHGVDLGYYDQHLTMVSDHHTVLEEIHDVKPTATIGELRTLLAAFGFGEDLYDRQVASLSGGERARLALLRLLEEEHNTLLLDEPTNHLDARSRESLEEGLAAYDGTLVVVSHDRRFLDKIVDRLVVFPAFGTGGALRIHDGNYGDYRRWLEERRRRESAAPGGEVAQPGSQARGGNDRAGRASAPAPAPDEDRPAVLSKNEQARRRTWIAEAEAAIAELEQEKAGLVAAMSSGDEEADAIAGMGRRCQELDAEIGEHMARWEQWSLELEGSGEEAS
jgi:ATP-binding cassette subfamily F protein 3